MSECDAFEKRMAREGYEEEMAREKDDGKGVPDVCKAYGYRAHFRLLDVVTHSHSTSHSHCILSLP